MVVRRSDLSAADFGGLGILDYTSGRDEKSSFAAVTVPPNVAHKLSWSRRSDKFYYIIDGELDFEINGQKFVLDSGDFCIVRKGDRFRYGNSSGRTVSLVLVHTPSFRLGEEVFE